MSGKIAMTACIAAALALAGCSDESVSDEGIRESNQSLAAMLSGAEDLDTVSGALHDTGLAEVFDGPAYYTLLAPVDDAFAAAGDIGADLEEQDRNAVLAAILRSHILPGYLTGEDIARAIADAGGEVRIQTMGDQVLTFTDDGGSVRVTAEDGATATILANEAQAGNGVLLPIDGLLKQL